MLENRIVFEDDGRCKFLGNEELTKIFLKLFHKDFDYTEKYFKKVGCILKPVDFSFNLNYGSYDGLYSEIREIDDADFVAQSLRAIKKYRIIGREGVYLETKDIQEGEYVLAHGGEPLFKITWGKSGGWIYTPTSFASYNKTGTLKHNPNLDIRPNQVEIELSVKNQKREKRLVQMYKQISEYYRTENLKVLSN